MAYAAEICILDLRVLGGNEEPHGVKWMYRRARFSNFSPNMGLPQQIADNQHTFREHVQENIIAQESRMYAVTRGKCAGFRSGERSHS